MPLVGLLVGYAASLAVSNVMHYAGALLLIGLGAWEVWEEMREAEWVQRVAIVRWASGMRARRGKTTVERRASRTSVRRGQVTIERATGTRATQASPPRAASTPAPTEALQEQFGWSKQLLLALAVSLDELAVGFSLGAQPFGRVIGPLALCLYIGIQGFVMATLGIALGRGLRARLKLFKEASELIGAVLLIGLGIGLLFFS